MTQCNWQLIQIIQLQQIDLLPLNYELAVLIEQHIVHPDLTLAQVADHVPQDGLQCWFLDHTFPLLIKNE